MLPKLTERPDEATVVALRARFADLVAVDAHLDVRIAQYVGEPVIHLDDDGRAWLVAPVGHGPGVSPQSVLPVATMHDVHRFTRAGITFHDVAIVHELDPDGLVRHLVPQLLDGPRTCPEDVASALVGSVVPSPRAPMADLAARMTGFASGGERRAAAPAVPRTRVVLGVLGPGAYLEPGRPALWVTLGALGSVA